MRSRTVSAGVFAVLLVVGSAATARAQSAIAGVVRDSSGGVLPGVTVEAASEALIEKQRTVFSDGQGQYNIVDLRPGSYVVTFTLPGFNTIKRDGIELPASFTATVNAEMRVGALEETVIVSGAAPTVDVHSATSTQVVPREVYDALPTARNVQAVAQLMPGVRMNVSDVGGSQAMQQQQFLVRGSDGANNTVTFDGVNMNSLLGDGATVPYFNDATVQEFSFQTGGLDADTTAGGGRLNVVPKDGGNKLNGSTFFAYSDGSWQGDNFDQRLRDAGLTSAGSILKMNDLNGSVGGPLKKDRVWFLLAGRKYGVDNKIPSSTIVDDQFIKIATARLTWQVTPSNKLSIHYDRMYKFRGHRYEPPQLFLDVNASRIHDNPIYYWTVMKWTSTISPRLLLEVGQSDYVQPNTIRYQPGVGKDPFTPEWYATASRADRDLNTIWTSPATSTRTTPERYSWQGSLSYVTGSHHFKTGGNWAWGRQRSFTEANADLQQEYRNGVADSVLVRNTPVNFADALMNADAAIFAQDSWTMKKVTVTGGVRYEYFDASIPEQFSPAGRFVGPRQFAAIEHVPQFSDVVPRLSAVYDVFGNGKTAIKGNLSKYLDQRTLSLTTPYSPLAATTARLTWRDTNADDIAQGEIGCVYLTPGCEIQFSGLPQNFGIRALNVQDPDLKRSSNLESSVAVQHELLPRLSVGAGWYRRGYADLLLSDYIDRSQADYTPITVVSPLDGEVITAYNLAPGKLSLTRRIDTNASSDRKQVYNSFELSFNARLQGGVTVFGGTSHQRTVLATCDQPDDPNLLRYCDQGDSGLPLQTDFKLNVSYPVPLWGLQVSGVFQSTQGRASETDWLLTRTTRYAADCKGPCTPGALVVPNLTETSLTIPLTPLGTEFLDRANQLDMRLGRRFRFGRARLNAQLDLFNALNANPVEIVRSFSYGTPGYLLPAQVLLGRLVKVSAQVTW
jgi:hypothetical protein